VTIIVIIEIISNHIADLIERSHIMAKKKLTKGLWTKDDLKVLKGAFSNHPTADVAAKLGRPTEAVKKKASRMGLSKTKKYMKTLGRS
jgi:hypothetical protein